MQKKQNIFIDKFIKTTRKLNELKTLANDD